MEHRNRYARILATLLVILAVFSANGATRRTVIFGEYTPVLGDVQATAPESG
jgi:hypothetical protein